MQFKLLAFFILQSKQQFVIPDKIESSRQDQSPNTFYNLFITWNNN